MVSDVLSAIVSTLAVKQSLVSGLVLREGDAKKLMATPAKNSQNATA